MDGFPSVFVSHGAPTLIREPDSPARAFLSRLGQDLGQDLDRDENRPRAVLCITAHWETESPTVSATLSPETIHDFYGFPQELYDLSYGAPGAPELAARTRYLLNGAGLDCAIDAGRGLDHGAWVPLMLMYPQADIPVVQLSVQTLQGPRAHVRLGRALAPLRREGVLVLASGGAVHNLTDYRHGEGDPAPWATGFEDWLVDVVTRGAVDEAARYRTLCPHGAKAHPRDEHFLPLLVAMGAGIGPQEGTGRVLYRGFEHGGLSMAAFAFSGGKSKP